MMATSGLTDEADDYFRTLPGLIYPQALVDFSTRIANQIVEFRYELPHLQVYFASLLNDRRGDRQGLPAAVVQDLQHLRERMIGE